MLIHTFADLFLGSRCPGCDRPRLGLCPTCRQDLTARVPMPTRPDPCPPGFPFCVAATAYDRLLRRLVPAFKERDALWLRGLLADRLAGAVEDLLGRTGADASSVLLVPLPSDPRAVRARGLDVTAALARSAARRLRRGRVGPVRVVRLLRQRRRPRDQAGLTATERWANLHGALAATAAARRVASRTDCAVVLVDDVTTTGATLTEAARALAEAGVEVTGAAVVAATQRRTGRRTTQRGSGEAAGGLDSARDQPAQPQGPVPDRVRAPPGAGRRGRHLARGGQGADRRG